MTSRRYRWPQMFSISSAPDTDTDAEGGAHAGRFREGPDEDTAAEPDTDGGAHASRFRGGPDEDTAAAGRFITRAGLLYCCNQ